MILTTRITSCFSPSAPISRSTLFAGRSAQIEAGIEAVFQRGMHGIIFGERGVGKTSMANCLADFIPNPQEDPSHDPRFITPRINCTNGSTYESIWKEVFSKVSFTEQFQRAGFTAEQGELLRNIGHVLPRRITPADVQQGLELIARKNDLIVVIDEFDKLTGLESKRLMADSVKALSDHSIGATILFVGVGDTVNELIAEHQSVSRCLRQIPMPRMHPDEVRDLVDRALTRFNETTDSFQINAEDGALALIAFLSHGLPSYAHLLAQHASRLAIEENSQKLTADHVNRGLPRALEGIEQSVLSAYLRAVTSPHKNNLYREVLAGAALTECDLLGFFSAGDMRDPLAMILGRAVEIPSYIRHLEDFCEPKRGGILQRRGEPRNYRYRFADALMMPFVIIQAFKEGKLNLNFLRPQDA